MNKELLDKIESEIKNRNIQDFKVAEILQKNKDTINRRIIEGEKWIKWVNNT